MAAVLASLTTGGTALAAGPDATTMPAHKPEAASDQPCASTCLTPSEAIALAHRVAPKGGVAGRFAIFVKAAGTRDGRVFLNSETDYRASNCLTVSMTDQMAAWVAGSADIAAVRERFVGKWLIVDGVARRVPINITLDGKRTGKSYYQVHVRLNDPKQIRERAKATALEDRDIF